MRSSAFDACDCAVVVKPEVAYLVAESEVESSLGCFPEKEEVPCFKRISLCIFIRLSLT